MWSKELAIVANDLCKTYVVFEKPTDRLKQYLCRGKKQYGRSFNALSNVSFTLRKGEVLGIVGNNGAGKSTLLQLVCQTLKPSSGDLKVNGRVAALLELGAGFNPEFTGRENIFLNASVLGLTQQEIVQRYESIVEFSGIGDFIEQPVKTYSSGMYVRLAFAIATSVEPDILIIDEALSVGDGAFSRKSFDRIMELKNGGATILFCSHSMYHIEAICDQAIWLERGRMVMLGVPQDVTKAYGAHSVAPNDAGKPTATGTTLSTTPIAQGNARLLDVSTSADGVIGKALALKAGTSNLRVAVRFVFDPELPVPAVAFFIATPAGLVVSSASSVFDGASPNLGEPGTGDASLFFPKLSLMRGKYLLSIYLTCEKSLHIYDQALFCAELDVGHAGIEQGVCFLPHAWNNGEVMTVPVQTGKIGLSRPENLASDVFPTV